MSRTPEPKSGASANSAIPAGEISIPFLRVFVNLDDGAHREWGACEASGICADAARAHKRVDTCGFHPLENHPFPLDSLAQTRDRRPLRNKGNGSRGTVAWLSPPFRSSQITYCYTYGQLTLCRSCVKQPTCVAVRYLTLRIRRYMARKARPCGRKNLCRSLFSKRSPVSGLRQTKK